MFVFSTTKHIHLSASFGNFVDVKISGLVDASEQRLFRVTEVQIRHATVKTWERGNRKKTVSTSDYLALP